MSRSSTTFPPPSKQQTMLLTPSLVRMPGCFPARRRRLINPNSGFSFSGQVREPFPAVIDAMAETEIPVTAIDAPSSWSIEAGPPSEGVGSNFHPDVLISLTAPKPLVKHFRGRHFIGGRYVLGSGSRGLTRLARPTDQPHLGLSRRQSQKNMTLMFPSMMASIRSSKLAPTD